MTPVLAIAICLTGSAAAFLFRRELLALGHAIASGVLKLKARLREIDDDVWRR